ncbi:UDP-glycosyltransferase 92A1-like [Gossypium australe]|uniref:UDP-glycosyltransferase 92A1-like n=1 Tax=Gossypium australe TaxID=47621 RepID=A0A5B6VZ85_9ROSI|nr:UDP-glycosyltransferase 92A1-like [Gossypium australe]
MAIEISASNSLNHCSDYYGFKADRHRNAPIHGSWPLIPFLSLATQIHHRTGFNIAIANAHLNIQYLRSTFHQHQHPPPWIHLFELPFNILAFGSNGKLVISSVSLKTPFHNFLLDIIKKQGKPPLCIISDVFFGWVVEVANIMNTVNITFATGGAYGTLALFSFWLNLPHRKTDSEEFNLPGFPERCKFHVSRLHEFMRKADGNDSWSRFLKPQLSSSLQSFGWLTNTAEELEPLGLDSLRKYTQFPVWPIGPLLPKQLLNKSPLSSSSSTTQHAGKSPGISAEKFLYISFGSQNTVSRSQMMELAIGLEKSWKPFIRVIRLRLGFDLKAEFRSELMVTRRV